jgi:hypothetical protein
MVMVFFSDGQSPDERSRRLGELPARATIQEKAR